MLLCWAVHGGVGWPVYQGCLRDWSGKDVDRRLSSKPGFEKKVFLYYYYFCTGVKWNYLCGHFLAKRDRMSSDWCAPLKLQAGRTYGWNDTACQGREKQCWKLMLQFPRVWKGTICFFSFPFLKFQLFFSLLHLPLPTEPGRMNNPSVLDGNGGGGGLLLHSLSPPPSHFLVKPSLPFQKLPWGTALGFCLSFGSSIIFPKTAKFGNIAEWQTNRRQRWYLCYWGGNK